MDYHVPHHVLTPSPFPDHFPNRTTPRRASGDLKMKTNPRRDFTFWIVFKELVNDRR